MFFSQNKRLCATQKDLSQKHLFTVYLKMFSVIHTARLVCRELGSSWTKQPQPILYALSLKMSTERKGN